MRTLAASIVIGPLMLLGALSAFNQPTFAPGARTPMRLAAGGNSTEDREGYAQKAQEEMQQWNRKLHNIGDSVAVQGKAADSAAHDGLNEAWTKAEAASHQLQTAGADSWESAKAAYEKASRELENAWDKRRSVRRWAGEKRAQNL